MGLDGGTPTNNLTVALALAETGISIFPADGSIAPTQVDPQRISKKPLIAGWQEKSTSDTKQIRQWWHNWPDALPAIDCGKSGLLVIDLDRKRDVDGISPWRGLVRKEGGLPEGVLIVDTANGGMHVYFRADRSHGNGTGSLPAGIDVRSVGGYTIAPGAGVADGRCWSARGGLLAFTEGFKREKLPHPPAWLVRCLCGNREARKSASIAEPTFPSMNELRLAVKTIPNDKVFASREAWRNFIAAIKHEALLHGEEDEGFELAREWSAEWDDSSDADEHFLKTWASLKRGDAPGARTGRTILQHAVKHGYSLPIADEEFEDERPKGFEGRADDRQEEKPPRPRMYLEDIEEAAALALTRNREPLIAGLLDEGAMSVIYGPSNVGKTFVILDMAMAVSTGRAWNGRDTTRGFVVYVAAEGGFGVNQRLLALLRKYEQEAGEVSAKPLFAVVKYPIDLRTNEVDADQLCLLVDQEVRARGFKCGWIIVDTLARAMAGGDENSSVDMGRIVTIADRVRHRTGAHVTFVHHTGKDVAKGARGHSCLRAATDTELEVRDGKLSVEKQRDMRFMAALSFSLIPVELGRDPRGRTVTSATVDWGAAVGTHLAAPLDEKETAFVHAVERALEEYGVDMEFGGRAVRAVEQRRVSDDYLATLSHEMSTEARRSDFRRKVKSEAVATIVSSHDDGRTRWFFLKPEYAGFDTRDETTARDEKGAFGKRSGGQPEAADRDRPPADPCARRSLRL